MTQKTMQTTQRPEAIMSADRVKSGTTVLRWSANRACVLGGFYTRLANCVGPTDQPVVVGLRACVSPPEDGRLLHLLDARDEGCLIPRRDCGQPGRNPDA
jgi:hypothetical protein